MLSEIRQLFTKKKSAVIDRNNQLKSQFPDFAEQTIRLIEFVEPFTMTSPERISAMIDAVEYVTTNSVRGDVVECGVWRGGSMMAAACSLIERNSIERSLFLFDTFEGMSDASEEDRDFCNVAAATQLEDQAKTDPDSIWCYASIEDVRMNMSQTQYPAERIRFIKGKVEETLPNQGSEGCDQYDVPREIAILRLDTDWYESTRVGLEELYPRLVDGGVLIIDDYGHWKGCRKAVDEYFAEQEIGIFLHRIDYTGRIAIKPIQQKSSVDTSTSKMPVGRY